MHNVHNKQNKPLKNHSDKSSTFCCPAKPSLRKYKNCVTFGYPYLMRMDEFMNGKSCDLFFFYYSTSCTTNGNPNTHPD